MNYEQVANKIVREEGVERSTMMKTPCLRYKGNFMAMMFDKEDALIIKVSPDRVNEIISEGRGNEFNFTKKRFKEWVLIPLDYEDEYESFIYESLEYARKK
ncbi:MAG: hypothetical protein ACC707_20565 [Thiohalomonadales bacterium]